MSNDPQNRIKDLEVELAKKENEINQYLDRIEQLENTVMKLESLIEDAQKNGNEIDPEKFQDTKISIELSEKEKQIRDLKNKLGYMRKEKIQLQQKLDRIDRENRHESTVIRIEEKKPDKSPLDALVKELQVKINKQKMLIENLQEDKDINSDIRELKDKLTKKNEKIADLKSQMSELKAQSGIKSNESSKNGSNIISKSLTEELQDKLNKTRRQMELLKNKLSKYEDVNHFSLDINSDISQKNQFSSEIEELKSQLENKNNEIAALNETISCLENQEQKANSQLDSDPTEISTLLTEELQSQLNKAKLRISSLEAEREELCSRLQTSENSNSSFNNTNAIEEKNEIITTLKEKIELQDDKIDSISKELEKVNQKVIETEKSLNSTKEELRQKIREYNNLMHKYEEIQNFTDNSQNSQYNPSVELRIEELKSMIEELRQVNDEQRVQISKLRKS
ncbi:MAG: hypothetical protein GF317_11845 [Candidatus Lokiarchaeota archaeon]|nr:hypothetical protein [Candidatus Lokiarchaeota archaeon]MBD3200339.1 hypothetical protein [Candidatus Lokiarchaeota archaeon]